MGFNHNGYLCKMFSAVFKTIFTRKTTTTSVSNMCQMTDSYEWINLYYRCGYVDEAIHYNKNMCKQHCKLAYPVLYIYFVTAFCFYHPSVKRNNFFRNEKIDLLFMKAEKSKKKIV